MKTVAEVLKRLEELGSEQTRKTFSRHGADVSKMFGVKVADLKLVAKQIKGNQALAMELFDSGNLDAQYLAGIVADGGKMTKKQLESWAKNAGWEMVSDYTVAWVASENPAGRELALKWMNSKTESIACSGWNTYSAIISTTDDSELELDEIDTLLDQIAKQIHKSPNRVKYVMNGFVIAVGCSVKPLSAKAKAIAKKIGQVEVDMGDTSCKVPDALTYINKVELKGGVGKKRKSAKC
jgi:3-methyladenine DNA glycosylase AlkD